MTTIGNNDVGHTLTTRNASWRSRSWNDETIVLSCVKLQQDQGCPGPGLQKKGVYDLYMHRVIMWAMTNSKIYLFIARK